MFSLILLGIIQGITEFLPVSSSAHLIIFRDLFNIGKELVDNNISLTFDIALHLGTLLAVVYTFFHEFVKIFFDGILQKNKNNQMLTYIILSTVPACIFGVLFDDYIESFIREKYLLIALSLIVMGVIIYFVDIKSKDNKNEKDLNIKDSIIIGLFQVFALIPGFSRSGTTITAARLLGYNREDSCKYSFFLSVPIILGAVFLEFIKTDFKIIYSNFPIFIIGSTVSFITGVLCINYLLKYINNHNFKIFMYYRLIFGLLIALIVLF